MSVFNRKSRMISFRLTADEYTEAVNRCQQHGYRSVSSLARFSTLGNPDQGAPDTVIGPGDFRRMQVQIVSLRAEVDRISALLPAPLAASASA